MTNLMAQILVGMVGKFLTERFVGKMIVYSLGALAKKTTNDVDDKMVAAVAEALGVEP